MKNYSANEIRNICILGPQGSGKTTLFESIFFDSGKISRKGDVDNGTTISDFTDEEIERKISIYLSVAYLELNNLKINLIDTPGFSDFIGECYAGLNVAENAILCFSAESGVDYSWQSFWEMIESHKKPVALILNKLDKENINFETLYSNIVNQIGPQVAPLYIPVSTGSGFDSIIDLINMKLIKDKEITQIPDAHKKYADTYREKLIEAVATTDESLMERYLNGDEIKTEELVKFIRDAYFKRNIFPLLPISCTNMVGIKQLNNFLTEISQPPLADVSKPFSGIIFKSSSEPGMGHLNFLKISSGKIEQGQDVLNTTRNKAERIGQISLPFGKKRTDITSASAGDIIALAKLKDTRTNDILADSKYKPEIEPIYLVEPLYERAVVSKNKGDEEKVGQAFSNILLEHPTVKHFYRTETKEIILSGVGNVQLEVIAQKVKSTYHVEIELKKPRVPYKETVLGTSHVQGKYKRQSGGRGQYGDCWLKIEPRPIGGGFEFVDKIVGGIIPKNYIPSIEKGVREAMEQGVIAGYPVVDIKVTVDDGSFHEVDSSDMAFKIAGAMALRKGVSEAKPCILEPILNTEIIVPEEFMGTIIGDLNSKRGKVLGMERVNNNRQLIKAQVPWGEMFEYLIDLKSLTRGAGKFKCSFSHYEIAPPQIAQPLIEQFQKSKTQQEE